MSQEKNIEGYVWGMAGLWVRKVKAGSDMPITDYILIETAKLVESGEMSDKTGREITNYVRRPSFKRELMNHMLEAVA